VKTQVAQKANAEHLVETLHSTDPKEKEVTKKTLSDYVVRLLFLQRMITGRRSSTLDLNLFRDTPRVLKAIEDGTAATGATKGQPWALATKIVYWGALAGVLRRLESYEEAHAVYSTVLKQRHAVYEEDRKTNLWTPVLERTSQFDRDSGLGEDQPVRGLRECGDVDRLLLRAGRDAHFLVI